jgi:hypothetical protein
MYGNWLELFCSTSRKSSRSIILSHMRACCKSTNRVTLALVYLALSPLSSRCKVEGVSSAEPKPRHCCQVASLSSGWCSYAAAASLNLYLIVMGCKPLSVRGQAKSPGMPPQITFSDKYWQASWKGVVLDKVG